MDVQQGTAAPRRRRRPSAPEQRVLGISAALVVLTAASLWAAPPVPAGIGGLVGAVALPWWVLALGYAATEATVLHIQVKREAQTVSVSELSLVLGLFFAGPPALLAGRLVGSATVLLLHRRSTPLKTAFNLALAAAETAVAVLCFHVLAQVGQSAPALWLAALAATLLANTVGIIAVGLVIAAFEGGLRPRELARDVVAGQPATPVVVAVALVAVTSLAADVRSAGLLLLAAAGLLIAYRAYASLSDRHLNLERLYRFTQAVTSSPEVDVVLSSVLGEARELLKSERAEVAFPAPGGGHVARVRLGPSGRLSRSEEPLTPADEWLLRAVVGDDEAQLLPRTTRDAAARAWLAARAAREAIAVPLRGGAGTVGVLVVTDRLGDVRTFDDSDVLLLETVANHASVALQNGELVDRLRHEALHDALTGLPNRAFLQRRLTGALDDVRDGRSAGAAVMILDLDGFKDVNDTLGHQQGDRLLVEVGARLGAAVGAAGTVTRLGGDEFAVLVTDTADEDRVVRLGRRLLRALEQPVALDGLEVEVGGSLGIALAPVHATDAAGLLKRADVAMYDAKGAARGLRVYGADLDTADPRRLTLVAELRAALATGGIEVHVQPQARVTTGEVVGVEALVRWDHPELGRVSPEEFVPIAERTGLIGPLTTHVLDRSLAACAAWRAGGHDLAVAVNLSARSLYDADLVDEVARLLARHDVPAGRLTLEVTEGSVMADPARAIALLHQLRDLGVRLSVDDFGTGYSSLSYLKRLPVHEVKIDRSFVMGLQSGAEDVAIVRAVTDLGRHLDLEVVAEGVEDAATWELLREVGCDLVQGWYLGRPMPAAELLPWLRSRPAARGALRAV
ncbi:diguanylate cyclase (GGDEF)-like protein [Geodermatophilus tzadiensis]|uniref:Diguanylate cyclase (GGDEF)-like protein n=1 Tax=Geodermatophilus tzadiensis TaxID=1137988 RepID=A0A2T0TS62_9ACTN|nr:bifunctional diguanylate cyclase/phosphodiesterase [Geodermatophilus tzadiensis]PRY48501.1 diguanylate cyclase (GGDEF)-like protein [Geodermatophilus tzadiensis]